MSESILQVDALKTHFPITSGPFYNRETAWLKAVDGVSLCLDEGEILGLVGESGCGKSTLARTIMRLLPATAGTIQFNGKKLTAYQREELRRIRPEFQMIFQDPYASLNPRKTVYDTLAEPMLAHQIADRGDVAAEVGALMEKVGLAKRFVRKYPHEFSGGQRQRIAIARALALKPRLIIADEPVSALDVSVQAQILNLLRELCQGEQLAMILISHDLAVVRHMADRIAVMYLGRIVEEGPAADLFERARHPYTRALLGAILRPSAAAAAQLSDLALSGDPPSPVNPPAGCAFHPRCPWANSSCADTPPALISDGQGHAVACFRADEIPSTVPQ
jgi:oligopeptide transport system ATP-binding protein